jgi:hypothetical protein
MAKMSRKISVVLEVEVPAPVPGDRAGPTANERAIALAEAVIVQLLPRLAAEAGIGRHRLAGILLVELGYVVGLSHTAAAALDALAVATERMRDALADKKEEKAPTLAAPTVPAPTSLQ